MPLLLALDLVIAMPISWWPLVSDYNRFAEKARGGFLGTLSGYTLSNTWFYFLGAAIAVIAGVQDIITAISTIFLGNLALVLILVDETDNAFADIYSTAVSLQNISPKTRQWKFIAATTILGVVLALTLPLEEYEGFLLMIGGLFVPLLGTLIAYHYTRKSIDINKFYGDSPKIVAGSLTAWILGVAVYFYVANYLPWIGASIPSFATSAILTLLASRWS